MSDLRPCLWLNGDIEEAAHFYATAFPDSAVLAVNAAPADYPGGKAGEPVTIDMEIAGQKVLILAGGAHFAPSAATSLIVVTEAQAETDHAWDTILQAGGQAMACGWISDHFGFAWQVTPRRLLDLMADPDKAERAFAAMQNMIKIDIATLERAVADA